MTREDTLGDPGQELVPGAGMLRVHGRTQSLQDWVTRVKEGRRAESEFLPSTLYSTKLVPTRMQNWACWRGRRGRPHVGDLGNGEPKDYFSLKSALFCYHLNSIDCLPIQRNAAKSQLLTSWVDSHSEHEAERGLRACKPCISLTAQSIDLFPAQSGLQGRVEQGCVGAGWGRTWIEADSVHFSFRGSWFWPCPQVWAHTLLALCALPALCLGLLLLKSDNNTVKSKCQPFCMERFHQFC